MEFLKTLETAKGDTQTSMVTLIIPGTSNL